MAGPSPNPMGELFFLPLGGAGEIGMNLYLYGCGAPPDTRWIMVDLGVKFADERQPGVDVILPDISFIAARRDALLGILLTHAHEDHFGAVIDLWPDLRVPVYATPFCAALLRAKLVERGMEREFELREVAPGDRVALGPFDVEYIPVTHSIPEPNALAIRTAAANVLHSGDWKIDDRPMIGAPMAVDRLTALGDEGCDVLVCDSTNILRDGISPSESDVAEGLKQVIGAARNRVAVTTFASNVGRLRAVALAAKAADRHLIVVGRAMFRALTAARDCGYLGDVDEILSEEEYGYLPRDKVVCLCTGSQGESRAALARVADQSHPNVALNEGDMVVFSSRTIPGNEKAVARVENSLAALGVELVTADDALVHVTGHPRRGEVERMYHWLRPRAVIPMHGEERHLRAHARFAREMGVPQAVVARNGEVVCLAPGAVEVVDEVPSGQLHMDGRLLVPAEDGPTRQRRKLGYVGHVAVALALDGRGDLVAAPRLRASGLPELAADGTPMADLLRNAVDGVLASLPRPRRRDGELVEEAVRRAVRKEADLLWGKKPVCEVMVLRID